MTNPPAGPPLRRPGPAGPFTVPDGGRRGPVALAVVGCLLVLLVVGLVVRAVGGGSDEEPAVDAVAAQDRSLADVAVGDGFDDESLEEADVGSLPVVPCEQAHDNEVYARAELPRGPWPGDDAVFTSSSLACEEEFEAYVGTAYADSELEYFLAVPTEDAWSSGDRTVLCSLYSPDGRLTGSMRGSGR